MTRVLVEAERNISSAAGVNKITVSDYMNEKRWQKMVELDQFKTLMNSYVDPLAEMRDSL